MNRHDEKDWRSDRDRHYGFREDNESARTAGDDYQQPFSQNPYGYYPGQRSEQHYGGPRRGEWGDTPSQRYGQREPYNAREAYESRSGGEGRSRYSESQYGIGRGRDAYGRDRYGGQHETQYEDQRGRQRQFDDDRQGSRYQGSRYGRGNYESSSSGWRSPASWGATGSGSRESGYGDRGAFGEGPFADTSESPGYFGSGNYGDGGASYGGGFDQHSRTRYPGSLDHDPMEWRGEAREGRREPPRYRTGPKGYTRSDDRLREDISERLMMADSVDSSDVTVSVKDAKVTLEGRVPDRRMKHAIEDLVDNCPGVQDIDNRIRVGRPATTPTTATTGATGATGNLGRTRKE
jgi:hypothetical protein